MSIISKWRYQPVLDHLIKDLENIRLASKMKAGRKNEAIRIGDIQLAAILDRELSSESRIFYGIQDSIKEFCKIHALKDPFII